MDYVTISDDEKTYSFHVTNGTVSFKSVKEYFPKATGLTYMLGDDVVCPVDIENNRAKIINGIKQYKIFALASVEITPKNNLERAKNQRIVEILKTYTDDDSESVSCLSKKNTSISKDLGSCSTKKSIFIGWKHKYSHNSKYVLKAGAKQILNLVTSKAYSYEYIVEEGIKLIKNEDNSSYFTNCFAKLGNFKDEIYDKFVDKDNCDCDFWSFAKRLASANREIRLYIFTSKKTKDLSDSCTSASSLSDSIKTIPSQDGIRKSAMDEDHQKSTLARKSSSTSNPITAAYHGDIGKNNIDEPLCKKTKITSPSSESAEKTAITPGNVENIVFIQPFRKEEENCINFVNTDVYGQQKIKILKKNTFEENDKSIMSLNLSVDVVDKDDVQVSSYKVIGTGSFGMVKKGSYKGTDVAVKMIRFTHNNKYILRELKIMDKLRHPNIVSLMAVFVDYGEIGLVMEYFESNTLRTIINRKLNLSENQKHQICIQISKAIAFLHSMTPPIFHKDIKPENILVNGYLVTKVCDMGLSRLEDMPDNLKTTAGRTVGTVAYMAPEVLIYYESGNAAADVWALACVFVELYKEADVWSIPPNTLDLKETYKEIVSTQKVPDLTGVPANLSHILKACFDHDPNKRPKASTLLDIFKMLEVVL